MNRFFYKPYYFDWLLYYCIFTTVGYLSNFIDYLNNTQEFSFNFFIITTSLGMFLFIGIPLIIRNNLKNKRKTGVEYFVSFSTNDRLIVEKIINELDSKTNIIFWIQSKIELGENFKDEIEQAINRSSGCIIFNSKSFQDSNFIQEVELKMLEEKSKEKDYEIIPILLEEIEESKESFFDDIQSVRGNSKPINRATIEEYTLITRDLLETLRLKVDSFENKPLTIFLKSLGWLLAAVAFTGQFLPINILNYIFFIF